MRKMYAIITYFNTIEYVNVIPLEQENLSPNLHAGEQGTSIGQGQTSDVSYNSRVLMKVDLEITTNESCDYSHPGIVIL